MQEVDAHPALRTYAQCRASVAEPLAPGPSPAAPAPGGGPVSVILPQIPAVPLGLLPGAAPLAVAAPAPSSGSSAGGGASAGSADSGASAPGPSSQSAAVSVATGWTVAAALMAAALPALL